MCGDLCGDVYGDMWERMPGRQKPCQACIKMPVYLAGLNGCLLGQRFGVAISNVALRLV
jgi:hypothetical protein